MTRGTSAQTVAATYSVELPDATGSLTPVGTGFFVSPDGYFLTAAHVITDDADNVVDPADLRRAWLTAPEDKSSRRSCVGCELIHFDPEVDVAVLKVAWDENSRRPHLVSREGFPYLTTSARVLGAAESVYAFGYPLPLGEAHSVTYGTKIGFAWHGQGPTSEVVASRQEYHGPVEFVGHRPPAHVLDKAVNRGNTGGPVVAADSGRVHGLCVRFQRLASPQGHVPDKHSESVSIVIPSLYVVVANLTADPIGAILRDLGVPIERD